jgi:PKD repeat protein
MSDQEATATTPAKKASWLKTLVSGAAGLLSGAFMMYASPLLDRVIKPAKPVANFAVEQEGMTVAFYNRSAGGGEGWWDFGDGSPLEPVASKQETVTHTYGNLGTYIAKLNIRNLIGEESERTFSLQLAGAQADPPSISYLEANPISPGAFAPATFRIVSKSKNARLCIWEFGEDRPLEISNDTPNSQDRLVSFTKPGGYTVKLAAVNGEQAVEKSTIVYVDEPSPGMVTAILYVSDQATRLDKVETPIPVTATLPPEFKGPVYRFDRQIPAKAGYEITAARWEPLSQQGANGVNLQIAPDRRSAHLTGELINESSGLFKRAPTPPSLLVRAFLAQERRVPDQRAAIPVTTALAVPGSVLLPLPSLPECWIDPQRQLRLEMRDGDRLVWQESQLPRATPVTIQNRRCLLSATRLGDQVRIELSEVKAELHPSAN